MVKNCPNCGTQLDDNIKFCTGCGSNVENVGSTFCQNCGAALQDGVQFCNSCGSPVRGANPAQNQAPNNNNTMGVTCPTCGNVNPVGSVICTACGNPFVKEKHTAAIVIGYILAILIPIGGIITGIYLLTRKNKDVHFHGVIMIVLAIVLWAFWLFVL